MIIGACHAELPKIQMPGCPTVSEPSARGVDISVVREGDKAFHEPIHPDSGATWGQAGYSRDELMWMIGGLVGEAVDVDGRVFGFSIEDFADEPASTRFYVGFTYEFASDEEADAFGFGDGAATHAHPFVIRPPSRT